jgi:hypothetical protein
MIDSLLFAISPLRSGTPWPFFSSVWQINAENLYMKPLEEDICVKTYEKNLIFFSA